jgi:uracil-DNA glycosylase
MHRSGGVGYSMSKYAIQKFIRELKQQPNTDTIGNPYQTRQLATNLRHYLEAMLEVDDPKILLVGEAPGYKGCKLTGIPFSSGEIFQRFDHPFLLQLSQQIKIKDLSGENTATIVWEYLTEKGITPLFWNSFPFHPHAADNPLTNRAPNSQEVQQGIRYLQAIAKIYQPEIIAGVGNKGTRCAQLAFPDRHIPAIRHPSFGGKNQFIAGMEQLLG